MVKATKIYYYQIQFLFWLSLQIPFPPKKVEVGETWQVKTLIFQIFLVIRLSRTRYNQFEHSVLLTILTSTENSFGSKYL